MNPKVYLCAGASIADELNEHARTLRQHGAAVVSRWHGMSHPRLELDDPRLEERALTDLKDLREADLIVVFSMKGRGSNRGGRHVELGFALAHGIRAVLIGDPEHAFHTVVTYRFETVEQMIDGLTPLYFER